MTISIMQWILELLPTPSKFHQSDSMTSPEGRNYVAYIPVPINGDDEEDDEDYDEEYEDDEYYEEDKEASVDQEYYEDDEEEV